MLGLFCLGVSLASLGSAHSGVRFAPCFAPASQPSMHLTQVS